MSFIWPLALASLLCLPGLVAGYVMLARGNRDKLAALGSMGVVIGGRRPAGGLRHLPYVLFGLALAVLAVGAARPQLSIDFPRRTGTVILAFDTSASMLAGDIEPTRLDGAKEAAKAFVDDQPATIEIGVVSFGRGGFVVQQPTSVTEEVVAAIDRLVPEGATSLGAGIFTALDAIVEEDLPAPVSAELGGPDNGSGEAADAADLEVGFYGSATIIVFTDGEDTSDIDPFDVAAMASAAGVKVHTIGVGTAVGAVVEVDGVSQATALDEDTLAAIAEATGGEYFGAEGDGDLAEVYDKVDLELEVEPKQTEVTALTAGIGVALMAVGSVLSMLWFARVP